MSLVGGRNRRFSPMASERDIMKIVYLADLKNPRLPDKDIYYSLKKKGDVKVHDSKMFDMKKIMRDVVGCDLLLFHGEIGNYDLPTQFLILERMRIILQSCGGKKVMWFFDKIWGQKLNIITELYNFVDAIFINDETWLKRFTSDKIFPLHPAVSDKRTRGRFRKELACDFALIGNIYGNRGMEYEFVKSKFGGRLKVFNDKFGRDFADVCKSARIVLAFGFPFDDFYWSDMIYKVLNCGGFIIHPRTQGLKDEGFKEGEHYFDYQEEQELFVLLQMLSDKKADKERKQIARKGQEFVRGITYSQRLDEILNKTGKKDEI